MKRSASSDFALDGNGALVLFDDLASNSQAETRALRLAGIKRLENPRQFFLADAWPGITHANVQSWASRFFLGPSDLFDRDRQEKLALFADRFDGVEKNVDECLLQPIRIALDRVVTRAKGALQPDVAHFQLRLDQAQAAVERFGQPKFSRARPRVSGKSQQLRDNGVNAEDFALHDFRELRVFVLGEKHLHECPNGHHGILDLVGQPRGKGADAGQLFEPLKFCIQNRAGTNRTRIMLGTLWQGCA